MGVFFLKCFIYRQFCLFIFCKIIHPLFYLVNSFYYNIEFISVPSNSTFIHLILSCAISYIHFAKFTTSQSNYCCPVAQAHNTIFPFLSIFQICPSFYSPMLHRILLPFHSFHQPINQSFCVLYFLNILLLFPLAFFQFPFLYILL